MSNNFHFQKNTNQKETENKVDTTCDVRDGQQVYQNLQTTKGVEAQHCVKYVTDALSVDDGQSVTSSTKKARADSAREPSSVSAAPAVSAKNGKPTKSDRRRGERPSREEIAEKCYDTLPGRRIVPCDSKEAFWRHGKYVQDDCGSGIVPHQKLDFYSNRRIWCSTPLTTYQASHGELGRKILCGEELISRRINPGPPCNVCEIVLPLCRGYYRKYECDFSPCERDYQVFKGGRTRPRTKVERYWEPCLSLKERSDVNKFAPQNVALAEELKKNALKKSGNVGNISCW